MIISKETTRKRNQIRMDNVMKAVALYESYSNYDKVPDETYYRIISNLELTRKEDFLWYSVRHADAYVDVHVCGRKFLQEKTRTGISDDELRECASYYYKPYDFIKLNDDAEWYGMYFSPMIAGESCPKVWIRFPGDESLYWYFIKGVDDSGALILDPDPRKKSTYNLIKRSSILDITRDYPISMNHYREQAYKEFEKRDIGRPDRSDLDVRVGFLVYPFPEQHPGDKQRFNVMPVAWDTDYKSR